MAEELRQTLEAMIKKLANDLGLPKVDVDRLIGMHEANLDALVQTSKAVSTTVQEAAKKQRETCVAVMKDAMAMATAIKPGVDAKAMLSQQKEAVERAVNTVVAATVTIAEQARQLNADVFQTIVERLSGSVNDAREILQPRNAAPGGDGKA